MMKKIRPPEVTGREQKRRRESCRFR